MSARRHFLRASAPLALGVGLGSLGLAALARPLARMTEGPFYPPVRWRNAWTDQDADLTQVRGAALRPTAEGEHLDLQLRFVDARGTLIDRVEVEIWQCDVWGQYRHPSVPMSQPHDEGFQGFGATRSDAQGLARFRTIRPVVYPGRAPHIHFKLRHAAFGDITSQLFVAGDAHNAEDGLWRYLAPADRQVLAMDLQQAVAGAGFRWQVRHTLEVPV